MNKKGISAIVTTVLIILITVASVMIIWVVIESLMYPSESCDKNDFRNKMIYNRDMAEIEDNYFNRFNQTITLFLESTELFSEDTCKINYDGCWTYNVDRNIDYNDGKWTKEICIKMYSLINMKTQKGADKQ